MSQAPRCLHGQAERGVHCPKCHTTVDEVTTEFIDSEIRKNIVHDPVHHPAHYTAHPSGVECIDISEHMSFCLGNALKYIWRAQEKGKPVEDLRKAIWYINREIERIDKFDPVCLIHMKKRSEHDCLYCCLCFKSITPDECHIRHDGSREDVCLPCAKEEAIRCNPK